MNETPFSVDIKLNKRFINRWGNIECKQKITQPQQMEPVPAQPTVGLDDFLLMGNKCKIALLKVQSLGNDLKLKSDIKIKTHFQLL